MRKTAGKQQEAIATGLTGLLADTYVLYHSTQVCHWNVDGPQFHSLHALFEEQYRELSTAIDAIAERIRCLGFYTPGTLAQLTKISRIREPGELRGSKEMLRHLIEAHHQVVHRANEVRGMAEAIVDEATGDLVVERLRAHETAIWMLRSQAGRDSAELAPVEDITRAS